MIGVAGNRSLVYLFQDAPGKDRFGSAAEDVLTDPDVLILFLEEKPLVLASTRGLDQDPEASQFLSMEKKLEFPLLQG